MTCKVLTVLDTQPYHFHYLGHYLPKHSSNTSLSGLSILERCTYSILVSQVLYQMSQKRVFKVVHEHHNANFSMFYCKNFYHSEYHSVIHYIGYVCLKFSSTDHLFWR